MPNSYDKFAKSSETDFHNWMTSFTSLGTKGHELFEAVLDKDGNASLTTISHNFLQRIVSWIFKPKSRRINTVIEVALGKLNANAEYLHKSVDELEKMRMFFYSGKKNEKELFIKRYEVLLSTAKTNNASTDILIKAKKDVAATCEQILEKARHEKSEIMHSQSDQAKKRIDDIIPEAEQIKKKAEAKHQQSLLSLTKIDLTQVENYMTANIKAMEDRLERQAAIKQKELIEEGNTKAKEIREKSKKEQDSISTEMNKKMNELHLRYPSLFNACLIINIENNDQPITTYFTESYLNPTNAAEPRLPEFLKKLSMETCPADLKEQLENKKIQSVYELTIRRVLGFDFFSDLITFLQTGEVPDSIDKITDLLKIAKRNNLNNKIGEACLKKIRENMPLEKLYSYLKGYLGFSEPEIVNEVFKAIENIAMDQFQDLELAKTTFYSGFQCYSINRFNDQQRALINQLEINLLYPLTKNSLSTINFDPIRLTQRLHRAVCNLLKAFAKNQEKKSHERRDFLDFILYNILQLSYVPNNSLLHQGEPGERIIDHLKKEKNYLSTHALQLLNSMNVIMD